MRDHDGRPDAIEQLTQVLLQYRVRHGGAGFRAGGMHGHFLRVGSAAARVLPALHRERIGDELGGRRRTQLFAIVARVGRAAMRGTIDEVHVEAGHEEVVEPPIAAIRRAHPVGGLAAAAVHQHQRIRMALARGQLEAHMHLAIDGCAAGRCSATARRRFDRLRTHTDPEEALVPQADGSGFAAGERLRTQQQGTGRQSDQREQV
jgi:hypothetical protein